MILLHRKHFIAGLVPIIILSLLVSCTPEPEERVLIDTAGKAPLKAPELVRDGMEVLDIGFDSCRKPGPDSRQLACLGFSVEGGPGGDRTMELTDPKNPQGTVIDTTFCTVRLSPGLEKPAITSEMLRECRVPGVYDLSLSLADGTRVADYLINDIGRLVVDAPGVNPDYDVELLTTKERTLSVVFPHSGPGMDPQPLFAVEYLRDECVTKRSLTADDGWTYSFSYAGGELNLLPPRCLAGWPEYLRARGAEEGLDREAIHAETSKRLEREKKARDNCGSGG